MTTLLQAATQAPTSSFGDVTRALTSLTPYVLAFLTYMQVRSKNDRDEIRADIKAMDARVSRTHDEVTTLNTHVGVDGNGIISRLDGIVSTLDDIKKEMAENRGANRTKGH